MELDQSGSQSHFQRIAHKETRVNLEPASPASVVHIRIPNPSRKFRDTAADRRHYASDKLQDEETAFRSKNLATAASIYHRKHHQSPRSFLWRLLDDGRVLSLRAADICKKGKADDTNLILHLRFPNPIRPACIALADPQEHDALNVFVLDDSNHLYTITLRPDHFRKRAATENGLGDACKSHTAGTFSFKHPHRLVAASASLVVVTFHDGGIIRFDKNKSDATGGLWKETNYSEQRWTKGLFNSFVPVSFQGGQTVKYGKAHMELTAATSAVADSLGLADAQLLFTVCLDHRFRIWNVHTGAIIGSSDLLGVERDPQELGKWVIDPSRDNLVRLVGRVDGKRTAAVYSPVSNEFKFWKIEAKTADGSSIFVHDLFKDAKTTLKPPMPSSGDAWTLADFGVSQSSGAMIRLWVLWKNNLTYRVQQVEFDSADSSRAQQQWEQDWTNVHIDNTSPSADAANAGDSTDSTEKWLQVIFYPGRFSRATLETALAMFERGLGSKETSTRSGKGLVESICSVMGATATLDKLPAGGMDYEQFRSHSEVQWRRFHRLVLELDKQRGEALSLAMDHNSGVAWVLCADLVAIMHHCSDLEKTCHNTGAEEGDQNISMLVFAGLGLVENFADSIMQQSIAALRMELFEQSTKTDMDRIQRFFDESGSWRGISEEDAAQVVDALGNEFRIVTPKLYRELIDLFETSEDGGGREEPVHPLTEFGRKLFLKAVQETVSLQRRILQSQLLLLVHMEYEYDDDNEAAALHNKFDIGQVYRQIIDALKRLELVRWLVQTQISIPISKPERSSASPTALKKSDETRSVTVFEACITHLLSLKDLDGEPLASSLTEVVVDICAPNSSIELSPVLIQCSLLKQHLPDLALELGPFCDRDPFSVYIQGRVALSLKDYTVAALHFKKAAVGMSKSFHLSGHESQYSQVHQGIPLHKASFSAAGLLDSVEKNMLHSGPANYYAHIVNLYDRYKAFSFVIDFARLSLQFAHGDSAKTLRSDMSTRLFNAATTISRFEMAHATLLAMSDRALQHSLLKQLVESMCEKAQTSELISLPFSGLQQEVDDILDHKCKATREVIRGTPYHKILYSWRITHNDYRGAAAVMHDRLQKLRQVGEGDNTFEADVLDTSVTQQYLMLINALSCVDSKQAWITVEDVSNANGGVENGRVKGPLRKVVTLAELRRQYQAELDRIAAIQNNQFGLAEDDDVMVIDD